MEIIRDLEHSLPRPTAAALGLFDGVHLGHREVIAAAAEAAEDQGLAPCVFTFETDTAIPLGKAGLTLLQTASSRYAAIASLGVDYTVCPDFGAFATLSPKEFVENVVVKILQAKVVCCGQDYRFGKDAAAGVEELTLLCAPHGIQVILCPVVLWEGQIISSSLIRKMVEEGNMEAAAQLLGAPFTLEAVVETGRQLGRQLHFPTINQLFPPRFTLPKRGVYATRVTLEGKSYPAVTNVGHKPTVSADDPLSAETHIIGYSGDLYGQLVAVRFARFLRPETKFPDTQALSDQIAKDVKEASAILTPKA